MEATARDIIRPIKVGRQVRRGTPADETLPILIVDAQSCRATPYTVSLASREFLTTSMRR